MLNFFSVELKNIFQRIFVIKLVKYLKSNVSVINYIKCFIEYNQSICYELRECFSIEDQVPPPSMAPELEDRKIAKRHLTT